MATLQNIIPYDLAEKLYNKAQATADAHLKDIALSIYKMAGDPDQPVTFDTKIFCLLAMKAMFASDGELTQLTADMIAQIHLRQDLDSLVFAAENYWPTLYTKEPECQWSPKTGQVGSLQNRPL